MIVATAGHVDHGKTTLVRALTGVATDRLAEEQRRGMTIDLGFAYADLAQPPDPTGDAAAVSGATDPAAGAASPAGACAGGAGAPEADVSASADHTPAWVGFIDVPGHERFIRNMLAGVAAIDLGLLVVAADDGPMPQTLEHLAILRLLGVPRLVLALTKADRVSARRLAEVRAALDALLAAPDAAPQRTAEAAPPVFTLATPRGDGVAALRQHLAGVARALVARPVQGHFRLAIDRSFVLAGAGRVVAGTVLSGRVQVGDTVTVSPQGQSARVRSLHADHRPAQAAVAGQRCALNLAGTELKRAEPARGDWLLAPEAHAPTARLDVWLQPVAGAPALSARAQLQLHLGAAAVPARLALLATREAGTSSAEGPAGASAGATQPGSAGQASPLAGALRASAAAEALAPGFAQLLTDRPVHAVAGDRFIVRDAASNRTLAGGWVVDPAAPARGRARPARLAQLAALALPNSTAALAALLAASPDGVALGAFAQARNLRADEAERLFSALGVQPVAHAGERLGVSSARLAQLQQQLLAALAGHHAQHPDARGADEAQLGAALGTPRGRHPSPQLSLQRAALAALVADGRLRRAGVVHHLPGHQPVLAEADAALLARVLAPLQAGGLRPPIVGELATLLGEPLPALQDFLMRMAAGGLLVRVAPNRWYPPEAVAELAGHALALTQASPEGGCDAARYRDRTGIGRNLTVQVLEFLDRSGYTRFDGQRHRPV